jgi:RNA polymerase sigma factor (sigma-70 family)
MRVAVFGAAGHTGRHVVGQALLRAHGVTAFVRERSRAEVADLLRGSVVDDPLRARLDDIGRTPPPSPSQEEAFVHRMEAGRLAMELRGRIERGEAVDEAALEVLDVRVTDKPEASGPPDASGGEAVLSIPDLETRSLERLVPVLAGVEADGRLARQQLLDGYLQLVVSVARQYEGRGPTLLDLSEAGSLGLVRAVSDFEASRSDRFAAYAEWHIRRAITWALSERAAELSGAGPPSGLAVVIGDARDGEAVERAIVGQDAIVSVLALPAAEREFEHSEAALTIIEAALRGGVRRLVVTTGSEVFADRETTGHRAPFAREDERIRDELRRSGLDWTIGAAPWVTNDPPTGTYETVVDAKPRGKRIAAADFATFVLDAIECDEWIGHVVGVSGSP